MTERVQPVTGFDRRNELPMIEFDLDAAIANRLKMPGDGIAAHVNCNCTKPTRAIIKTMWTGIDKGRRAVTCPAEKGKQCDLFVWLDAPFHPRASIVIDHMYKIVEKLEFENSVGMGIENINWVEFEEENGNGQSSSG